MTLVEQRTQTDCTTSGEDQTAKKKLFVISPIGKRSAEVREQADQVLALIKDAVGDLYNVKRADEYHDTRMTNAMLNAIETDHVVVAYLGKPPWNPNVMLEIGYRLSTNRPLLTLVEEDSVLPFDLQDFRHYVIPKAEDLEQLPYKTFNLVKMEIRSRILDQTLPLVTSPYPVAEIIMDTDQQSSTEEKRANSFFTMTSRAAEEFFHAPGRLAGRPIEDVLVDMLPLLEESQLDVLTEEQDTIIGRLHLGRVSDSKAKIPFIFKNNLSEIDPEFRGNAYLPLILHYHSLDNALILRVLYSKVPVHLVNTSGDHLIVSDEVQAN